MRYLCFVLAFSCVAQLSLLAQNSFGALHSNYTPTNSLFLNPSSILDAKVWLDVNIVGVGSYVNNDLVYLQKKNLFREVKDGINGASTLSDDDIGYNQNRNKYHAYNRNFVAAPSVVWSQGDHGLALSLGARSYTGIRKVPSFVAQFIENGVQDYTEQHDIDYSIKNLKAASINFGEVKLTYAYTFLKRRRNMFMGGVSVSKLFAIAGGAANIYEFDFNVDNDSITDVALLNADAMYTSEASFNTKSGVGFDIGFTYQHMLSNVQYYLPNTPKYGCNDINYKYKIGVSIIDIGSIKFDNSTYSFAGYDFTDYSWLNYSDTEVDDDNVTSVFSEEETTIEEGRVKRTDRVRLPTFISGQFDYNLWQSRVYVNATIVQGIPPGRKKFGLRHANSLSITPRFESYWFDFALPFSLYEYQHPQLGASVRVGPLTVGTDKLINWISKSNVYGADFYVYLKIPIQYNPKCRDRIKGQNGRGKGRHRSPTNCTI